MKKNFSFLILFISILSFAQIKFKQGYFISNNGTKTDCLIKDSAWKDYPEFIFYKETEKGEMKKAGITTVKEFSVDETKYVRFTFDIDKSAKNLNAIGEDRNPVWVKKTAFLKLLVDGDTQLYKYSFNGDKKYFIKKGNESNVEQLIYKQFLVDEKDRTYVQNNNDYKKQLDSINPNFNTANLKYDDKSLINWFSQYSGKNSDEIIKREKGKFNIRIKPTFISSNMKFDEGENVFKFDTKTSFTGSLELEYVFGFNKSKWAVFTEPTYYNYAAEKTIAANYSYTFASSRLYNISSQSIVVPLGIKHYMYLNNKNKLSLSGAFVINIPIEYSITIQNLYGDDFSNFNGLQFGLGYTYNNKFSLDCKIINQKSGIGLFGKLNNNIVLLSAGYNIF
ncbi:hypothetical protein PQ459_08700 [Chryseobacterium sp. KACC 21268]|nr:hypothetical protein PQ459_08700 [Chryseobacterium sp. KACC 21268]